MGLAVVSLLAGMWAGLLRLGWGLPTGGLNLSADHGPLMVSGFLGTLISLERAVAIGAAWAYAAPALTATGAILLLVGRGGPLGPMLITLGSIALILDCVSIIRRQSELFAVVMALGAVAWAFGNALWLASWPIPNMVFWWVAFLVLTVASERLELSRLRGPSRWAQPAFAAATAVFISGLVLQMYVPQPGALLLGSGLIGFAGWIALYDVARKTMRMGGLPGFVAINMMMGAFWLGLAGMMRIGFPLALNFFQYDAILHAIFLGFVFSMIFAHAPIILPAITVRPVPFRRWFYLHVVLLQLSLGLRICGDLLGSAVAWHWGGMLNVIAVATFLLDTVYATAFAPARATTNSSPFTKAEL